MAKFIRSTGQRNGYGEPNSVVTVAPPDGKFFSLKQLQDYVGGYIELIFLRDGSNRVMVVNEEGKLHGLPSNPIASNVLHNAKSLGEDFIVGDALLCDRVPGEHPDNGDELA